jgi:Domain of unknown function (DUF1835)
MLHITNGDATVPELRRAVEGEVIVWRDVLHEGPVPDVPDAELRRVRARFLAREDADDIGTLAEFESRDRALGEHGEFTLWFEADLYDQLQLIQILSMLRVPPERVTLVCVGEHVGIARFGGLGELTAEQLAALPATPLTAAAFGYAAAAWKALRAPDPCGLRAIVTARSAELRFVGEAFDRLGREYPSTRDGLSLTERRLLAAVQEGAETPAEAFIRGAARETRPFLGDTWALDRLRRLADGPAPLLAADPLRLTDAGRRVLAGEADHVATCGIDRWIGGVHLHGRDVPWRWDEGTESVSPARAAPS